MEVASSLVDCCGVFGSTRSRCRHHVTRCVYFGTGKRRRCTKPDDDRKDDESACVNTESCGSWHSPCPGFGNDRSRTLWAILAGVFSSDLPRVLVFFIDGVVVTESGR